MLELQECLSDDDYLNKKNTTKLQETKIHRLLAIKNLTINFSSISAALTFMTRYSNQTDLTVLNLFLYHQEILSKTDWEYLDGIIKILSILKNLKSFSTNIFHNFHGLNLFKQTKLTFPKSLKELNLISVPKWSIKDGYKIPFKAFNVKTNSRNFSFTNLIQLFEECFSLRKFSSLEFMLQFNCYELNETLKLFIKFLLTGHFYIDKLEIVLRCLNSGCLANGGNDCLFNNIVTNFYISLGDFLDFVNFNGNFTKMSSSIKSINISIL